MNTQFTTNNSRMGSGGMFRMFARHAHRMTVLFCALLGSSTLYAVTLEDISFSALSGDQVEVMLSFSGEPPGVPTSFTIDDPARIALDFPGVSSALERESQVIGVGAAQSITAVEAADRTRVVVNLTNPAVYDVEIDGNLVLLSIGGGTPQIGHQPAIPSFIDSGGGAPIDGIDFARGEGGEGQIMIQLSDPGTVVNISQEGADVVADFVNALLPEALDRKLNVVDFATPVREIDTMQGDGGVRMRIRTINDNYEYLAYQTDDVYMIEFRPYSEAELAEKEREKREFTGERLSLNFQSIEVRAVLQLLADFTGLNLVVSDTVSGVVTLRLKNVPWDQAMDIILKSKGLAQRQIGNVVMVAPQEEIANRERLELEAERQIEELAPLRTEYVSISYAAAGTLATLIQSGESSLLSERGNVAIDERTNTLIIKDTSRNLDAVRALVAELDRPVRQVLIESRIVNADNNFSKDIGVRFGYSKSTKRGRGSATSSTPGITVGGLLDGGVRFQTADGTDVGTGFLTEDGSEGLMVNLPAAAASAGSFNLAIGKVGSYLIQLELSALIAEGRGEEIANPRVITADQSEAVIQSGVEIPYQEASSSGATSVSFKDATLSLKVKPQITPDDRIFMDLEVNQDSISSTLVNGVPAINTKSVSSQVLVDNGETLVLGGIYSHTDRNSVDRIPFFGDLPYVGFLFRRSQASSNKSELLIFITPKILKEQFKI